MNGRALAEKLVPGFDERNYNFPGTDILPIRVKTIRFNGESRPGIISLTYNYDNFLVTKTLEYPIITSRDIKVAVQKGEEINLDFCFIKDFNYHQVAEATRSKTGLLRGFSAQYAVFDGNTSFDYIKLEEKGINLKGSQFINGLVLFSKIDICKGSVILYGSHFNNCHLVFNEIKNETGVIQFRYTSFYNSKISFSNIYHYNSIFDYGHIKISDCNFELRASEFNGGFIVFSEFAAESSTVRFSNNTYKVDGVDFSGTSYVSSEINFASSDFGDCNVNFKNAKIINGDVLFLATRLEDGTIDFSSSRIKDSSVDFSSMTFGISKVIFKNVVMNNAEIRIDRSITKNAFFQFELCTFSKHNIFSIARKLEIVNCIIENTARIDSILEENEQIFELSLENTKNLGQIYVEWEVAKKSIANYCNACLEGDSAISNKEIHQINTSKAKQMLMLKENYHNLGQYDDEDAAFVEYMRYKRKAEKNYIKKFFSWAIDSIGLYGTSPGRVAIAIMIVWSIFGLIFSCSTTVNGLQSGGVTEGINMLSGFYFSAITFLTIGYGDIAPATWLTQLIAPIEGVLGLFLMSYFTVAIVRKTLR